MVFGAGLFRPVAGAALVASFLRHRRGISCETNSSIPDASTSSPAVDLPPASGCRLRKTAAKSSFDRKPSTPLSELEGRPLDSTRSSTSSIPLLIRPIVQLPVTPATAPPASVIMNSSSALSEVPRETQQDLPKKPSLFQALRQFREKLKNGETLVGIGIQSTDPLFTDALADSVDFFWFDMEHIPHSLSDLRTHMIVAHGRGVPCMVRVPGPNRRYENNAIRGPFDSKGPQIALFSELGVFEGFQNSQFRDPALKAAVWSATLKQVLDNGADAIAVPQVQTVEEVKALVADCRYPRTPGGVRGFGPTIPMNYGRVSVGEYVAAADEMLFVAVMIETAEALDNVEEIAAVDGICWGFRWR